MAPLADAGRVLALKVATAAAQFVLLVATANWFGVEFRGTFALFGAGVQFVALLTGFLGSVSLGFLAARDANRRDVLVLMTLTTVTAVALPVAVLAPAWLAGTDPLAPHRVVVAVAAALSAVEAGVLLSGRSAWRSSLVEFLRPGLLLALAAGVVVLRGFREPREFFVVWSVAAVLSVLLPLPLLVEHLRALPRTGAVTRPVSGLVRDLLRYGFTAQSSNLVQFLNYRSLFFALERHVGLAGVGVFSTAVSFAEMLWLPASSLASSTLNRIARGVDADARALVLGNMRRAWVATAACALVAALVPTSWVTGLLGDDFAAVRQVLVALVPGVVALGATQIASAANAGRGAYGWNILAALAGLGLTGIGFLVLVPRAGMTGALVAMNASYLATSLVLIVHLARTQHVRAGEWFGRGGRGA